MTMGQVIELRAYRRARFDPAALIARAYTALVMFGVVCWCLIRLVFGR